MFKLAAPFGAVVVGLCALNATAVLANPRGRHVNVNAHRHVHVHRTVVVRPVRPWVVRPYYGAVVAGVTLGTVIAVSAIPVAPSSSLCWYWADEFQTRGYWDYCKIPQ
jgi:hypothetical protein